MGPFMKLVTTALKWSYAERQANVTSKHLKAAAELLTLRRDTIQIIDAENNRFKEKGQRDREVSATYSGRQSPSHFSRSCCLPTRIGTLRRQCSAKSDQLNYQCRDRGGIET